MMGKPAAVLHCDLDGARHIYRSHHWRWPDQDDDPLWHSGVERMLEFFDRAGVSATLFVIAADVDHPERRALLQEAVAAGHEIASHSLTHPRLATLDRTRKRAEIEDSRKKLEDALAVAVRGFRAPAFSIDREALELIAAAGYAYDSSVFPTPAFAARLGVNHIEPRPHRPLGKDGVVELPLPGYRPAPFPFHPCYSLLLGEWYFRRGLRRFRRRGEPLVLLFHLTDFAEPLPRERLVGLRSRLMTLSNLSAARKTDRCRRMLDLVLREYRGMTTGRLLEPLLGCGMPTTKAANQW